jgi:predicted lipoprotein with Yx(FWY)xxD motif
MHRRAPTAILLALLGGLALLAAACGSSSGGAADAAGAGPAATAGTAAAGAGTVATTRSDLGQVLVDGQGMTLYLFTPDTGSQSTCTGTCAATWPPLGGPATAGSGVDAALLGTTTRPDGSVQVTYAGHPVYLYAGDAAPGDVSGQGVGGKWYVVDPSGDAVTAAATASSSTGGGSTSGGGSTGGGYGY